MSLLKKCNENLHQAARGHICTCRKRILSCVCVCASSSLLLLLSWLSSFSRPRASSWAWRSASRCFVAMASTSSAWLCSTIRCSSAYTCQLSSSSFWALDCKKGLHVILNLRLWIYVKEMVWATLCWDKLKRGATKVKFSMRGSEKHTRKSADS